MSPRPVLATKSLLQNAFGAMLKGENVLLQNAQYGNLSFNMHCSWRFWQVDVPRFCNELFSRNSILSYNVGGTTTLYLQNGLRNPTMDIGLGAKIKKTQSERLWLN